MDPTATDQPEVLTMDHLAKLVRLSPKTIRAMAARGEIPVARLRRQWRIGRHAALTWVGGA